MIEYEKVALDDPRDPVVRPRKEVLFNGKLEIRVVVVNRQNTLMTGATCTIKVYDSTQAQVLSAAITPTISLDRATCVRILNAAAAGDLTAVGNYVAVVAFTYGSYVKEIKIPITVTNEKV